MTAETIDDELRNDLDALRSRSRKLEFDNDFMRNYLDIAETNIVGETAPRLISLVDNAPGNPDTGARTAITKSWLEWGKPGVCEISGAYSWTGLCQAIVRGTARDGEALVLPKYGPAAGNKWGSPCSCSTSTAWRHGSTARPMDTRTPSSPASKSAKKGARSRTTSRQAG